MKKTLVLILSLIPYSIKSESLPLESAHILLSFPHSGNHACRFIIEYLSGLPTRGCLSIKNDSYICKKPFMQEDLLAHVDESHDPFVYKEHWVKKIDKVCMTPKTLVIILRDFKEALASWGRTKSKNVLSSKNFEWYMDIIQYYENYKGKKMILYYEDLINNPVVWVEQIYNFYNFNNKERFDYFKDNAKKFMDESKKINYKNKKSNIYLGCYKNKSGSNLTFYQNKIKKESLKKIHALMVKNYNHLINYIKEYNS